MACAPGESEPVHPEVEPGKLTEVGLRVIQLEAEAVSALAQRLDHTFEHACQLLLKCRGRIVVTGMGKSGHIGCKVAATLASTGSPAFFVHPGEASHGDLGMITQHDAVLALSNSGETDEMLVILPMIKRIGVPLIAMTGKPESTLARQADAHLDVSVREEACPLGLAPTSSTTAALVMGDALAVALMEARGFTREAFAFSHPGGSLGRRLLLRVSDLMHTAADIPKTAPETRVCDTLEEMSAKNLGLIAIVDAQERALGVFSDGDLRRFLKRGGDIHITPVAEVMTSPGIRVTPDTLAAEVAHILGEKRITAMLVVDPEERLLGVLNVHDLWRAGIY
jgi:arabinose-5-phosphate isomerase